MNCRETERLIDAFFDGELDGRVMRDAAMHITRCRPCELLLQQHERTHDALRQTIAEELGTLDPADVWRGIAARVQSESSAVHRRALWQVFTSSSEDRAAAASNGDESLWLRPHTAQAGMGFGSLTGLAAMAASVTLAVTLLLGQRGTDVADTGSIASTAPAGIQGATATSGAAVGRGVVPVVAPAQGVPQGGMGSPLMTRASSGLARNVAPAASKVGPGAAPTGPALAQQVRIEKLNSTTGHMAMWSQPENNTAVIWLADEAPRAPAPR